MPDDDKLFESRVYLKPGHSCVPKLVKATDTSIPAYMPCAMCGGDDVHRKWHAEGDAVNPPLGRLSMPKSEFIKPPVGFSSRIHKAKKDCIVHFCRTCSYIWVSDVWKPVQPKSSI